MERGGEHMNSYSQQIEADIDMFQNHVQKLSANIQSAGFLWNDPQFFELLSGISKIASQARDVIVTGDKLCETINRFYNIAENE